MMGGQRTMRYVSKTVAVMVMGLLVGGCSFSYKETNDAEGKGKVSFKIGGGVPEETQNEALKPLFVAFNLGRVESKGRLVDLQSGDGKTKYRVTVDGDVFTLGAAQLTVKPGKTVFAHTESGLQKEWGDGEVLTSQNLDSAAGLALKVLLLAAIAHSDDLQLNVDTLVAQPAKRLGYMVQSFKSSSLSAEDYEAINVVHKLKKEEYGFNQSYQVTVASMGEGTQAKHYFWEIKSPAVAGLA